MQQILDFICRPKVLTSLIWFLEKLSAQWQSENTIEVYEMRCEKKIASEINKPVSSRVSATRPRQQEMCEKVYEKKDEKQRSNWKKKREFITEVLVFYYSTHEKKHC